MGSWTGLSSSDYALGLAEPPRRSRGPTSPTSSGRSRSPSPSRWARGRSSGGRVRSSRSLERRLVLLLPVAGLAVAGLAIAFAQATDHGPSEVLFSGQDQLPGLVEDAGSWSVGALALVLVLKSVAWSISLAGFRGGPTFPGLYLGAAAGVLASHLPGLTLTPAVAVGMGAGGRGGAAPAPGRGRDGRAPDREGGHGRRAARDRRRRRRLHHGARRSTARPRRGAQAAPPATPQRPEGRRRSARRPGRLQQRGHQLADRRRLDAAVAQDPAAGARHGVVQGARPDVLDEHGGDGAAGLQRGGQAAQRLRALRRRPGRRGRARWPCAARRRRAGSRAAARPCSRSRARAGRPRRARRSRRRDGRRARRARAASRRSPAAAGRRPGRRRSRPRGRSRRPAAARAAPPGRPSGGGCAGRRRVRGREQRVPGPGRRDGPSWDGDGERHEVPRSVGGRPRLAHARAPAVTPKG